MRNYSMWLLLLGVTLMLIGNAKLALEVWDLRLKNQRLREPPQDFHGLNHSITFKKHNLGYEIQVWLNSEPPKIITNYVVVLD